MEEVEVGVGVGPVEVGNGRENALKRRKIAHWLMMVMAVLVLMMMMMMMMMMMTTIAVAEVGACCPCQPLRDESHMSTVKKTGVNVGVGVRDVWGWDKVGIGRRL